MQGSEVLIMDLNNIQKYLLKEIADITDTPAGAFNIRSDSQSIARQSTENVDIVSKENVSGIDIFVKPNSRARSSISP